MEEVCEILSSMKRELHVSQETDFCLMMCASPNVKVLGVLAMPLLHVQLSCTAAVPHASALQYTDVLLTLLHSFISVTEVAQVYV